MRLNLSYVTCSTQSRMWSIMLSMLCCIDTIFSSCFVVRVEANYVVWMCWMWVLKQQCIVSREREQIERNKELAMKCEEQTWQQKQIGLEASDLRERLLDSHYGMRLTTLLIDKWRGFNAATVLSLFLLLFSVKQNCTIKFLCMWIFFVSSMTVEKQKLKTSQLYANIHC